MIILDLLIIGSGPAGLSAAIYSKRSGLNFLVVGLYYNSQVFFSGEIENYLGHSKAPGKDLILEMYNKTKELDISIIEYILKKDDIRFLEKEKLFEVKIEDKIYFFKTLLLCTGTTGKKLDIPGEKENYGYGVSTCPVCDGFFFKNKEVCVIGGGNSALDYSLFLSKICSKVTIINKNLVFNKLDHSLYNKCISNNVNIIYNAKTLEILGDNKKLSHIKYEKDKQIHTLNVNGAFIAIGSIPNINYMENFNLKLKDNLVYINEQNQTSFNGIFACGDLAHSTDKQIIFAAADGAKAALNINNFLNDNNR